MLLVHYSPNKNNSFTRRMVEMVRGLNVNSEQKVTERDLVATPPPLFGEASMEAYLKRNFNGNELTVAEGQAISQFDELADELVANDLIVLVFPMYNFSIPAAIKAWVDAVTQAKVAFKYGEYGPEGLLKGKRVVVMMASGGTRADSPRNFATPYLKSVFGLMGIDDIDFLYLSPTSNKSMVEKYLEKFKKSLDEWAKSVPMLG